MNKYNRTDENTISVNLDDGGNIKLINSFSEIWVFVKDVIVDTRYQEQREHIQCDDRLHSSMLIEHIFYNHSKFVFIGGDNKSITELPIPKKLSIHLTRSETEAKKLSVFEDQYYSNESCAFILAASPDEPDEIYIEILIPNNIYDNIEKKVLHPSFEEMSLKIEIESFVSEDKKYRVLDNYNHWQVKIANINIKEASQASLNEATTKAISEIKGTLNDIYVAGTIVLLAYFADLIYKFYS